MKLNGIALVACALGIVQFSFAQKSIKNIEWGAKAGFNYSSLNLGSEGKLVGTIYHPAFGYHVGGYALIKLNKKISVQPEIVYSTQGHYFTTQNYSNLKTRLNYINIPVMIKYYLTGSLHVMAGPQLGILVGSKGDLNQIQGGFPSGPPIFNQSLSPYTKSIDFALAFGAGINLATKLSLSVRYNVGITDINKNSGSQEPFAGGRQPSFSTAETRNMALQVSLGYVLHKPEKK